MDAKAPLFAMNILLHIGTRRRQFARNSLALSSSQNASASLPWSSSFHRQNVVVEAVVVVYSRARFPRWSRSSLFRRAKVEDESRVPSTHHHCCPRRDTRESNRRTGRRKAVGKRTFRRNDERFRRRKKRKAKRRRCRKNNDGTRFDVAR